MSKVPLGKIGCLVDFDFQLGETMARGYETFIEPCQHCEFNEQPTFKEETRMSYREVGKEGDFGYSRSICCRQEILVCLSCGEVHRVVSEIY